MKERYDEEGVRVMTERIRWQETQYGGFTGHVGDAKPWLFRIWKSFSGATNWILRSTLPGQIHARLYDEDREALKEPAEKWLEEFISSLGASFEPVPVKSRAWHADWAEVDRDRDGNAILKHKPSGGLYRILPIEES